MNPIIDGMIVFTCTFGAALLGMWLRTTLPEHQLDAESRDTVKVGIGLIATMTALVLGLITASAKSSFDTVDTGCETSRHSNSSLSIAYLPATGLRPARFARACSTWWGGRIDMIWPQGSSKPADLDPMRGTESKVEGLADAVRGLEAPRRHPAGAPVPCAGPRRGAVASPVARDRRHRVFSPWAVPCGSPVLALDHVRELRIVCSTEDYWLSRSSSCAHCLSAAPCFSHSRWMGRSKAYSRSPQIPCATHIPSQSVGASPLRQIGGYILRGKPHLPARGLLAESLRRLSNDEGACSPSCTPSTDHRRCGELDAGVEGPVRERRERQEVRPRAARRRTHQRPVPEGPARGAALRARVDSASRRPTAAAPQAGRSRATRVFVDYSRRTRARFGHGAPMPAPSLGVAPSVPACRVRRR